MNLEERLRRFYRALGTERGAWVIIMVVLLIVTIALYFNVREGKGFGPIKGHQSPPSSQQVSQLDNPTVATSPPLHEVFEGHRSGRVRPTTSTTPPSTLKPKPRDKKDSHPKPRPEPPAPIPDPPPEARPEPPHESRGPVCSVAPWLYFCP